MNEPIDSIEAQYEVNRAHARRAKTIDDARRWCEFAYQLETAPRSMGWSPEVTCRRVLESELAATLHVPDRTMARMIDESEALLHQLPGTYDALSRGALSYRHAQVIIDQALSLPAKSRIPFKRQSCPTPKRSQSPNSSGVRGACVSSRTPTASSREGRLQHSIARSS